MTSIRDSQVTMNSRLARCSSTKHEKRHSQETDVVRLLWIVGVALVAFLTEPNYAAEVVSQAGPLPAPSLAPTDMTSPAQTTAYPNTSKDHCPANPFHSQKLMRILNIPQSEEPERRLRVPKVGFAQESDYKSKADIGPKAVVTFNEPAHFAISEFESAATNAVQGLTIQPGMQLTFYSTGRFEVEFVTSPIDVPVSGTLTFTLEVEGQSTPTFTMPFSIRPPREIFSRFQAPDDQSHRQCLISYGGYSHQVKTCFSRFLQLENQASCSLESRSQENWSVGPTVCLHRTGTARFGFGASSLR